MDDIKKSMEEYQANRKDLMMYELNAMSKELQKNSHKDHPMFKTMFDSLETSLRRKTVNVIQDKQFEANKTMVRKKLDSEIIKENMKNTAT